MRCRNSHYLLASATRRSVSGSSSACAKRSHRGVGCGILGGAMSNYNWLEFAGRPAAERYPAWVNGGELWRQLAGRDAETLDRLLDTVVTARTAVRTGVPGTELELPRL